MEEERKGEERKKMEVEKNLQPNKNNKREKKEKNKDSFSLKINHVLWCIIYLNLKYC